MQFWSEIILVISNQTHAAHSFDFEITYMIADPEIYTCKNFTMLIGWELVN